MFRGRRGTRAVRVAAAGTAALLTVGIAACSGSSGSASASSSPSPALSASSTATAVPGGTARVALPAGAALDYIWPYMPSAKASQYNAEGFQKLLYRPLYMFGNNGTSVAVNYPLSLASPPVYSADGKTVTITMKGWKWSDGEPADASDVIFWLNMMKAEPAGYYGSQPGLLPDNLASYRAAGPDTVVLRLKSPVSSIWFTYDQLAEITPMPAAWDITSAGAKPGSGGCATDSAADNWAACTAVFNFLSSQAENTKTYATNPVWGVVDGPWRLSSFSTAGSGRVASFVPNPAYSGSQKPRLASVAYYAYPSAAAEYAALKSGQLDYGYIPPQDLPPVSGGQSVPAADPLGAGFTLSAAYPFSVDYAVLNFSDPTLGPAFRQLYVRQALQQLIDQQGMVEHIARGYGYPTSGGVPSQPGMPGNPWTPVIESSNGGQGPYWYSVSNATSLLTSHGWTQVGGVLTCKTPAKCGPGVRAGTKLSITLDYAAGVGYAKQEAAIMQSDMAQAGVQLNLVPKSFNTITGGNAPCQPAQGQPAQGQPAQANCKWQMLDFRGMNFNGPGFEPLLGTGAPAGGYFDPRQQQLIGLTRTSSDPVAFARYATYTVEQLPFLWLPSFYAVQATSSKLADVGVNPLFTFLPEYWYFTR